VELMGETFTYAPCKAIKSQILTDFVVEWTDTQLPPLQIQAECCTLYFDGLVIKPERARAYSSSRPSENT
jgi:hypothetical protein